MVLQSPGQALQVGALERLYSGISLKWFRAYIRKLNYDIMTLFDVATLPLFRMEGLRKNGRSLHSRRRPLDKSCRACSALNKHGFELRVKHWCRVPSGMSWLRER